MPALWTRTKRRPSGVRFRVHLAERWGTRPKRVHVPRWCCWLWVRPSRFIRFRQWRQSTGF